MSAKVKISVNLFINNDDEVICNLSAQVAAILKGISIMTAQADDILAKLAAATASSDAANAKCAELIALANLIKGKLDAALASGGAMTPAEVQAISDAITAMAVGDDAAKAAAAAAIAADTPTP